MEIPGTFLAMLINIIQNTYYMKTIVPYIFALPLLFMSVNVYRQKQSVPKKSAIVTQDQQRVQVDIDDLPEKVKASVGHDTELAWKILKAYLVTNPDRTTFYDLYVQKPDGETWMKVDKEGKVLN